MLRQSPPEEGFVLDEAVHYAGALFEQRQNTSGSDANTGQTDNTSIENDNKHKRIAGKNTRSWNRRGLTSTAKYRKINLNFETAMTETKRVLRMYRRILKLAQHYPSVKRESIIRDIKIEFHANKNLTDTQKIREEIASAQAGITELSMYANLHPSMPNWSVEVGRDAIQPSTSTDGFVSAKLVGNDKKGDMEL
ncbi:hypothetical protein PsorP6_004940 [Peronosclerospora sorghi]|uniref:Uncharacterized protein n=1 Tax=Peronosclerospora sorghi TaxID=230839 RepID=A0ACC0W6U9_9STRA|nr:hypothetical protein PsorP6_004940 [Peronosclerospora sorghi]